MPKLALSIAAILIAIGLIGYLPSGQVTAMIPAFVGAVLGVLGLIALNPPARKHAMHAAAAVALLGFLAGAGRAAKSLPSPDAPLLAKVSISAMALLCGVFVVACIRSFIAARRAATA